MDNPLKHLIDILSKPSEPVKGTIYTKIKRTNNNEYLALGKLSFFGKWQYLQWTYYDEQSVVGFTKRRATMTWYGYGRDLVSAIELVENFKQYKGSGITIW